MPANDALRDRLLGSLQESVLAEPASMLVPIDLTEARVRRRFAIPMLVAAAVLVTTIGIVATTRSARMPNIRTQPTLADPQTTVSTEVSPPCEPEMAQCFPPIVAASPTTISQPSTSPTTAAVMALSGVLASGASRGQNWQLSAVTTPTDSGFGCVTFSGGSVIRNICAGGGAMGVAAVPGFMAVVAFAPPDTQLPSVTTAANEFLPLSDVGFVGGMAISIGVTPDTNPIVAVAPGERCDYVGVLRALDTALPGTDLRLDNVLIDHCRDDIAFGSSAPPKPGYQTAQIIYTRDVNGWTAGPADHLDGCYEPDPSGAYAPLCSRLGYVPGYRSIGPIALPKETADLPSVDGPWPDGVYWAYVREVADGGHRLTVDIRKMSDPCVPNSLDLAIDCAGISLLPGSVTRTISQAEYFAVELSNGANPAQAFASTSEEFARLAALGDGGGKEHYEGTPEGFVFRLSPMLVTIRKGKVTLIQTLVVP